jgi:DMSO/TMAO reductase YedYZ molybdopterin-dependent catalytic subunit
MEAWSGVPEHRRGGSGRGFATVGDTGADRIVVSAAPYNAEAPLAALRELRTPTARFYARNHFAVPAIDPRAWRLIVDGATARTLALSLDDLRALPARSITTTMECAGNDRTGLVPLPKGEPWAGGAVSTTDWRGVALCDVLQRAGPRADTVEVLFTGADQGTVYHGEEERPFARSLPRDRALDPATLLAYEMGGEPLSAGHGGPVRLVVPDWYGMASVKWLVRVTALMEPFAGHFQREAYVLKRPGRPDDEPLREMRVKSLITSPAAGTVLSPGTHKVTGVAWSGHGPIARVEISTEGEGDWRPAWLTGGPVPHTWQPWAFEWEVHRPGRYALRARATDATGATQPDVAEWNHLGYANNAIQLVLVEVRSS